MGVGAKQHAFDPMSKNLINLQKRGKLFSSQKIAVNSEDLELLLSDKLPKFEPQIANQNAEPFEIRKVSRDDT